MKMMLDIEIDPPKETIDHSQKIFLTGSCFTEHIGGMLEDLKFNVIQNPNGILFDPNSVSQSLISYVHNKQYAETDLFYLNEVWNSWFHHSRFSGLNKDIVLENINASQRKAHEYLKTTDWLIITLGTSFSYRLVENRTGVANCHRAPAQWFDKHLMTIEEINISLDSCLHQLFAFNPSLKIIFTVSPVRHIRDGVMENNRSKARLIEVVHHLVNKFDKLYYFPSYELVIDVLRDYRFYDIDLVHPNYQATTFVLQKFIEYFVHESSRTLIPEIQKIITAFRHKSFQPSTEAHQKFLQIHFEKTKELLKRYPHINFEKELEHFGKFENLRI